MRRRGWAPVDVRAALRDPGMRWGEHDDGNPVARTTIDGMPVRIVIAHDDPGFVITIFERDR